MIFGRRVTISMPYISGTDRDAFQHISTPCNRQHGSKARSATAGIIGLAAKAKNKGKATRRDLSSS